MVRLEEEAVTGGSGAATTTTKIDVQQLSTGAEDRGGNLLSIRLNTEAEIRLTTEGEEGTISSRTGSESIRRGPNFRYSKNEIKKILMQQPTSVDEKEATNALGRFNPRRPF